MPRKAPPFPDDDDDENLFREDWSSKEYVRPGDPETSHEAAENLDITKGCIEAFERFRAMVTKEGLTGVEFSLRVERDLVQQGWNQLKAHSKAESWRRRLSDLSDVGKKLHWIETRPDPDNNGKPLKRDGRQLYFLPPGASNSLQPDDP